MTERNTALRSMHDLGMAAWFGGALMGAIGVNGAARSEGGTAMAAARISSAGWARWAPVNAAAVVVHLVGGAGLLRANAARVQHQEGVAASTLAKTVVTGAAIAAAAYSRVLGKKVELASSRDPEDEERAGEHPVELEKAGRHLTIMQWVVPALTGAIVVLNALHGEQQRPSQQKTGLMKKTLSRMSCA